MHPEQRKILEEINREQGRSSPSLPDDPQRSEHGHQPADRAAQGHTPASANGQDAGDDAALERLLRASDLETLFELNLGDYWNRLQLFFLLARGYAAGGRSRNAIAVTLQKPSSPLLADALARRVARHIGVQKRDTLARDIHKALKKLERFLGTLLVASAGEGRGCPGLTEAGAHLARLIEPSLGKCCRIKPRRRREGPRTA
jgi:hypothetical protein